MKIYRKVIPKICKDIVRQLLAAGAIEVEDGHRDDAELDLTGTLVEYLNDVDKISADAHEALQRHQLPAERLGQIKRALADSRKIALGDGALEFVLDQLIRALFQSKHIEEVFADDNDLRLIVQGSLCKYLGVDEELDREIRGRLKNLREGTGEWELEYNRLIDTMRHSKAG